MYDKLFHFRRKSARLRYEQNFTFYRNRVFTGLVFSIKEYFTTDNFQSLREKKKSLMRAHLVRTN